MAVKQEDDLKQQLGKSLADQCVAIRDRRRVVEQKWLLNRRMWMNEDIERRFINSDSSSGPYSIPAGRRASERTVVRTVKLLTPTVKWFEVSPLSHMSEQRAQNVNKFMDYTLRKRIRSRSNIGQLARSMFLCGRATQKTAVMVRNGQVWPSQRVVDEFAHYTFPETSSITDSAEVEFEDFLFSYEKYRTFVKLGIVDDVPQSDLTEPDWPYHLVERLAYQGITHPTTSVETAMENVKGQLQKINSAFCSMTEMWITREDKLYQVYLLWNTQRGSRCVGFFQSQYDEPLYRSVVHRGLPGELYTNSMAEDITGLDFLQNDLANKFLEAVDWEQGFVAAMADKRHDTWKAKGRALWLFNDDPRQAMQFIQPPVTSTSILRAWQIVTGMVNTMGGAGTITEGQPGRNMPRSGQAVGQLLEMGMADVNDVAELIEQEVLTPGLGDIYKVSTQFIPSNQLLRIPGGQGIASSGKETGSVLRLQDVLGDYEFDWIGSLQSQDQAARAQRTLIFLNLLSNPEMAQQLQAQGYAVNLVELIKTIWRDTLGERGLADIVLPLTELQKVVAQARTVGDAAAGDSSTTATSSASSGTNRNAVPGLNYNLPAVTNGFVQQ